MSARRSLAARRYRKFHGHEPDKVSRIDFPAPKNLVALGDAVAIEYRSDKALHGVRKPRTYRHKIGRGVRVYTDPTGKWLFIAGGRFKVTDWMRH